MAKYGPLFDSTYGQAMVRRGATYDFDPGLGKIDRGTLVLQREAPLATVRGRALQAHTLRVFAQLAAALRLVLTAAIVSGVWMADGDSPAQVAVLLALHVLYTAALLAVRPFISALMGAMELVGTLMPAAALACALAVMGGAGADASHRAAVGTAMLVLQCLGLAFVVGAVAWSSLRALATVFDLRLVFGMKPTPAEAFADVVKTVRAHAPRLFGSTLGPAAAA